MVFFVYLAGICCCAKSHDRCCKGLHYYHGIVSVVSRLWVHSVLLIYLKVVRFHFLGDGAVSLTLSGSWMGTRGLDELVYYYVLCCLCFGNYCAFFWRGMFGW